jgi:hypothetical protein
MTRYRKEYWYLYKFSVSISHLIFYYFIKKYGVSENKFNIGLYICTTTSTVFINNYTIKIKFRFSDEERKTKKHNPILPLTSKQNALISSGTSYCNVQSGAIYTQLQNMAFKTDITQVLTHLKIF